MTNSSCNIIKRQAAKTQEVERIRSQIMEAGEREASLRNELASAHASYAEHSRNRDLTLHSVGDLESELKTVREKLVRNGYVNPKFYMMGKEEAAVNALVNEPY